MIYALKMGKNIFFFAVLLVFAFGADCATIGVPQGVMSNQGLKSENFAVECPGEGYFEHPRFCDWFYRCTDILGVGIYRRSYYVCSPGTAFSPKLSVCSFKRNCIYSPTPKPPMVTPPITNTLTSVTPTEPPKKGNYSGGSITQDGCGVVLGDQSNTLCEAPWLGTRIRLVPVYRTAKIRCYGKVKPKCSQRKEAYHKETDSCIKCYYATY